MAFFTSVGYSNQKSLTNDFGFSDAASNSGSHKYNFRTNFDFNIIPLTEINVSLSGQVRRRRSSPTATAAWTCGAVTAT